jgi:hypothetical protein
MGHTLSGPSASAYRTKIIRPTRSYTIISISFSLIPVSLIDANKMGIKQKCYRRQSTGPLLMEWVEQKIFPHAPFPLDSGPLLCSTYCLPYIRLPELAPLHIHLEDGNCSVCRTLVNTQHLMRLTPESRSYTLISSHKNLRTRIIRVPGRVKNMNIENIGEDTNNYNKEDTVIEGLEKVLTKLKNRKATEDGINNYINELQRI